MGPAQRPREELRTEIPQGRVLAGGPAHHPDSSLGTHWPHGPPSCWCHRLVIKIIGNATGASSGQCACHPSFLSPGVLSPGSSANPSGKHFHCHLLGWACASHVTLCHASLPLCEARPKSEGSQYAAQPQPDRHLPQLLAAVPPKSTSSMGSK